MLRYIVSMAVVFVILHTIGYAKETDSSGITRNIKELPVESLLNGGSGVDSPVSTPESNTNTSRDTPPIIQSPHSMEDGTEVYKKQAVVKQIKQDNTSVYNVQTYRSTDMLPLFSKQLGLSEEKNPTPFSVMIFGNYLQSNIATSNFQGSFTSQPLNGILPGGVPLTGRAEVTEVTQRFVTGGVRFVVNILPFWSVYGLLAQSSGTTTAGVKVKADKEVIPGLGSINIGESNTPFLMAFDANSYGIGTSLAIGNDIFFSAIDANYVITKVESVQVTVHTVTASSRFGLHQRTGSGFFAMWVGVNYMENIGGSDTLGAIMAVEKLRDIFPDITATGTNVITGALLQGIVNNMLNSPAGIQWQVQQKPVNVFSAVIGMRYSPHKNVDFVTEVGFIDRVNVMISAAYNF